MPTFHRLEDFDAWYEAQRDKPSRSLSNQSPFGDTSGEKSPPYSSETTINVQDFVREGDFDELVINDCEKAVHIAWGLLQRAFETNHSDRVSSNLRNWSEAAKQSASIRSAFLDILESRKTLVRLDEVFGILGPAFSEVRNFMRRLADKVAVSANPGDPTRAKRAIETGVDQFLETLDHAEERLEQSFGKK